MKSVLRYFLVVILSVFCLFTVMTCVSQAQGSWQSVDEGLVLVNTKASILDRDGKRQDILDIYDSFKTPDFIVCSGPKGESPIYKIAKTDVKQMELDGFYTNMSGWEYAGCTFTLNNGKTVSGYIMVTHMGLHGYRTFEGRSDVGGIMISWKRLKKIEFEGNWIMLPQKPDTRDDV